MKKVTVKSNCHPTEATFLAPESIEDTIEAMGWLSEESERERDRLGRYGPNRKRFLEVRRKLCGIKDCACFVKYENLDDE